MRDGPALCAAADCAWKDARVIDAVPDNGDRHSHAAISDYLLTVFRRRQDPVDVKVHQLGKSIRDRAFFPRQVKKPNIAEHPIRPRWIGVANCDDPPGGYGGRSDERTNFRG